MKRQKNSQKKQQTMTVYPTKSFILPDLQLHLRWCCILKTEVLSLLPGRGVSSEIQYGIFILNLKLMIFEQKLFY
jgi:hypothetical protein